MHKSFIVLLVILGSGLFSNLLATDYYWVGGSGNWSDIRHWVTTSGGTVQHTVVPSTEDNVFFDANSFTAPNQEVVIDFPNVFCRSMDWTGATGNPRLTGTEERTLNVGGSFLLIPDMTWAFAGDVILVGTESGFSMRTSGHALQKQLIIDGGTGGQWSLEDDLTVDSMILLQGGNWISNDHGIQCRYLHLLPGIPSRVDLGTSMVTVLGFTEDKGFWFEHPPVWISSDRLDLLAADAIFELPASLADVRISGNEAIRMGTVFFSSPTGRALVNDDRFASFAGSFAQVTFTALDFNNNGYIGPLGGINTLRLAPGKSYLFLPDQALTLGVLEAMGTCAQPISIYASQAGGRVTWQAGSVQSGSFLNLRGIQVTGATFIANQSIDLGNNAGWTFDERTPGTLYWIGGNGQWSDPNHWSMTSGGTPAGCIPSAADDVIFDANSFNTPSRVFIDLEDALCRSMTWMADGEAPRLAGPADHRLHIFGSLELQPDLNMEFLGDFYFESGQPDQTITTKGIILPNHAIFNGRGGYRLVDALEVQDSIVLNSGSLNTNDQNVACEYFVSVTPRERSLSLGSSYVLLRTLDQYNVGWEVREGIYNLNAGTSTIELNTEHYGSFFHSILNKELPYHRLLNTGGYKDIYHYNRDEQAYRVSFQYVEFTTYGHMNGNFTTDTLKLAPGFTYTFTDLAWESTYEVQTLIADGLCDAYITLESNLEDTPVNLQSDTPYDVQYVILQDVHYKGSAQNAQAQQSLAIRSTGWDIQPDTMGRDLYWVGNGGVWHDTQHWSLSSGGPGGECIPTPIDNVFFDDNSFNTNNQTVTYDGRNLNLDCLNFNWDVSDPTHAFIMSNLNLYGSIDIMQPMGEFYLGDLHCKGPRLDNHINLGGYGVGSMTVEGTGFWRFTNDISMYWLRLQRGTLHLGEGNRIDVMNDVFANYNSDATLIGGTGHMIIQRFGFYAYGEDFEVEPESMLLELAGPYNTIQSDAPLRFHQVRFSSATGEGTVNLDQWHQHTDASDFNLLEFRNNGRILDEIEVDSLLFTPGHVYTLESQRTQTINDYWRIRGNNCGRIQLRSTVPGSLATTTMAAGEVQGDFIQMSDQRALGGATFYAGSNSTDVNNSNQGWRFESRQEFVDYGILGEDIVLCDQDTLILNQDDAIGALNYRWQDGSTDYRYTVTEPGSYYLDASFEANGVACEFRDTIRVLEPADFQVDLGADQSLCDGDTAILDGDLNLVGATYQWSDGLDDPQRVIDAPGDYILSATLTGCSTADTVSIRYVEIPDVDGDRSLQACEGETVTLDVTIPEGTYQWSTGATNPVIEVSEDGTYGITLVANGCEASDSFQVTFVTPPVFDLGPTREVCMGESLRLEVQVADATYLWDDSTTQSASSIVIDTDTWRYVDVAFGSCVTRDSVQILALPLPALTLTEDQTICPGDLALLEATHSGDSLLWSTGSSALMVEVGEAGIYSATSYLGGCTTSLQSEVIVHQMEFNPLPADTILCDDKVLSLDATITGGTYLWSDGSTGATLEADEGLYWVEVSDGICSMRDSLEITPRSCTYFFAYHPNAFSPNQDGINDQWLPELPEALIIHSFRMRIFDRWGGLLFETRDPNEGWDGRVAGEPLPTGVYMGSVSIEYTDDEGDGNYQQASDITLIR